MTRLRIFIGVLAILGVAIAVMAQPHSHPELSGVAHVIDGDTIVINDTHIRLFGVDAPERSQTCESKSGFTYECGRDATATLKDIIRGQRVDCVPRDHDRYNRVVAVCYTESVELNAEMVRRGAAVDFRKYSGGRYRSDEEQARKAGLGIWSGRFEMPEVWRHQHNQVSR